jgi:DnaJ family protein A protein 2
MFGGIPFEHFAHGGGMPGGGGRGRRRPAQDVDTTKLYETLEVEKDATASQIKKAYFRLSRIHHPDKGGDEHKFKEISAAYEILSDTDKRKMYDEYGLEGVNEEGGMPGGGEDDLMSMFFGGGGRSRRPAGPKKGPATNHPIRVSLADIYNGKTVKLAISRKVIVGESKQCTSCDGRGVKVEYRQIGPGMVQQMQRTCEVCGGQGHIAERKTERKILEVHVQKGMKSKQKVQFKGMGDEMPNMEPGDINFIVEIKDHPLFKRKGADLLLHQEVSLNKALCGFSFKITHLDGREILIKSKPGEIIQAEAGTISGQMIPFVKSIPGEGMPSLGNPFVKGNLYVVFKVVFPRDNELSEEQIKVLKEILPDPDMEVEYDEEEVEEVHLSSADLTSFGKGGAESAGNSQYDSDDEGGDGGVQCQQS